MSVKPASRQLNKQRGSYDVGFLKIHSFFSKILIDWIDRVIPHPFDPKKEIYRYLEKDEGPNLFVFFYERLKAL